MTAENIARVVADLRAGRVLPSVEHEIFKMAAEWARYSPGPVVDATAIYEDLVARDEPIMIYEDHPCIAPPWPAAYICYENGHGNVMVMHATAYDRHHSAGVPNWEFSDLEIDMDRVAWCIHTFVWCGGRSPGAGGPVPTHGPRHLWQFAVYDDGEPADLHWVQLVPDYPMEHWDMAHLVLLGSLNFLNCTNVELVEPARPRAERRRIARTGQTVKEINVFPTSRSSRGGSREPSQGVPLTSVRGHFACYGPEYDRGLLFGKIAGRFWIPMFARGSKDIGEIKADYKIQS